MITPARRRRRPVPLALELANTLTGATSNGLRDQLADTVALRRWLAAHASRVDGLAPSEATLAQLRDLRAQIREVLAASAAGAPLPELAVRAVNDASAAAPVYRQLRADGVTLERPAAADPAAAALARIADSAIQVAGGEEPGRLRVCQAPGCGAYFLARPREASCSSRCANRARAARRQRRAAEGTRRSER